MNRKSASLTALMSMLLLTVISCNRSNSANNEPLGASTVTLSPGPATVSPTPGTPANNSNVVSLVVYATEGGSASGEALDPIYAAYPALETNAAELAKINHSVFTTDSHLELYDASNTLVMVLAVAGNAASVSWTGSSFAAESIAYSSSTVDQKNSNSMLTFDFKACVDGKGQSKDQSKEPTCQTISAKMDMTAEAQNKQSQDPEQGQKPTPTPVPVPTPEPGQKPTPEPTPVPVPVPVPTPVPTPVPVPPTFSQVQSGVLNSCTACHQGASPSAGVDLTTYADVMKLVNVAQPSASALYMAVAPGGSMRSHLSNSNGANTILQWIEAGALNN